MKIVHLLLVAASLARNCEGYGKKTGQDAVNEVRLVNGNSKVDILSKMSTENREGELRYGLETKSEYFRAMLEFQSESNSGVNQASSKNEIRLLIRDIIEFVPSDPQVAGYQGEDPVSTYPGTGNWIWDPVVWNAPAEGEDVHKFTASTQDGLFKVFTWFSEASSGVLSADQVKMDFLITNFPYQRPGESKLAFRCQVRSKNMLKTHDTSKNVLETDVASSVVQGDLEWITVAQADGSDVAIISSFGNEESDEENGKGPNVVFTVDTLNNATSVLWDPSLGVVSSQYEVPFAAIVGAVVGSLVFLGIVSYIIVKRRRKRDEDEHIVSKASSSIV